MSETRTLPHGIDITAPGGIDQLFAFHRATFGDAVMEADGGGAPAGGESGGQGGDGGNQSTDGQGGGAGGQSTNDGQPNGSGQGGNAPAGDGGNGSGERKPPWGDDSQFDPQRAWNLIEGLREDKSKADQRIADAANQAAENAKQSLTDALIKALGIDGAVEEQTPEQLLEAVTAERDTHKATAETSREEARLAKIELAIWRGAADHDANPRELLDSRAFASEYAALDPTADDFDSKVSELVQTWKEKNPQKFGIAQVAARSGGDFSGGNGGEQLPSDDIETLRKARQQRRAL